MLLIQLGGSVRDLAGSILKNQKVVTQGFNSAFTIKEKMVLLIDEVSI
jgi:hypothetical protein